MKKLLIATLKVAIIPVTAGIIIFGIVTLLSWLWKILDTNFTKEYKKEVEKIKSLDEVFIVDVSCTRGEKYSHSMALDNEGNMYTWGAGYKGKLGHYEEWDHSDPAD